MRNQKDLGRVWLPWLVCLTLGVVQVTPVRGALISLAPGVMNPPPSLTSIVPETAVADKAQLVAFAGFEANLAATLTAQGYKAANNWVYSSTSPPLPAGLMNPVALPANATFHITDYNLHLNNPKTAFGELFNFNLLNPPADPILAGAVVTQHWLQLLNESAQFGGFGFAIPGQPGFWQVDNGDLVGGPFGGAPRGTVGDLGPYYDSNNSVPSKPLSVPFKFHDDPQFYSGVGTYLHFTTLLSWDVSFGGNNYIYLGDTGITWGFKITCAPIAHTSGLSAQRTTDPVCVVPEPSATSLFVVGIVLILITVLLQRTRTA